MICVCDIKYFRGPTIKIPLTLKQEKLRKEMSIKKGSKQGVSSRKFEHYMAVTAKLCVM